MASKLLAEWFWIDRWDGSSAPLLPMEAQGIYRAMLSQAWRRGARLPNDPGAIAILIRCRPEEWARSWPLVQRYWRVDGTDLVNDTQLEIYADALARSEAASERGKKGGRASARARNRSGINKKRRRTQVELKCKPPSPSPSPSLSPTPTPTDPPTPSSSTSADVPSSPETDDSGFEQTGGMASETAGSAPPPDSAPVMDSAPDLKTYVSAIASVFTSVPGAPRRIGPQDLELATAWHDRGIPLPQVVGSIQLVAVRRSAGSTAKTPVRSLAYFRADVEKAWEEPLEPGYLQFVVEPRFAELSGSVRRVE